MNKAVGLDVKLLAGPVSRYLDWCGQLETWVLPPRHPGKGWRHTFVLKEITPADRTALRPLSPTISFYNLRQITLPRSPRELAAELG